MEIEKFMEHGTHLCNFHQDQLKDMIDLDGVQKQSNSRLTQESVRMLSQYLVGNQLGTAEELLQLSSDDRKYALLTWTEVIKDSDTLRNIAKYAIRLQ